jgi:hypothetical protein
MENNLLSDEIERIDIEYMFDSIIQIVIQILHSIDLSLNYYRIIW